MFETSSRAESVQEPQLQRVAIYTRVLKREQTEGWSLAGQEREARAKATAMGGRCEVVGVYSDPGISGATLERPGLARLLPDAKAGKFDTLLVCRCLLPTSQIPPLAMVEGTAWQTRSSARAG